MHILLVTHYFSPENNAPQRRWDALGAHFIEAGHELTVITPPPHYTTGTVPAEFRRRHRPGTVETTAYGATVYRSQYLPHTSSIVSRTADHVAAAIDSIRIAKRIAKQGKRPDIVVATAPGIPSLEAGRRIAHFLGIPLVTEMRDAWPDLVTYTPGFGGQGPVARVKKRIHEAITAMQLNSSRVVTTTVMFAKVLRERGIAEPVVIRNGTSMERYGNIPPRESHRHLHVLYMGNLGRSQGLDTVIRAAAVLKTEGVPIKVRLVGHGAARSALKKLNKQLGKPVEILGHVAPDEVQDHYAWSHSLIVSLRDWEPFQWTVPSKLYEALATGRFITGILAGEAANVLREADGGVIVPPGEPELLAAAWRDLEQSRYLLDVGESGRDWVRKYSAYDTLATRYLELLDDAVQAFGAAASSDAAAA